MRIQSRQFAAQLARKGMELPARYFRAGAGALIIDAQGLVLALERTRLA